MALSKKDVEHVARLARVALTEEEKEKFTVQLGNILEHIEKLKELDTSQVQPTAHPFFVRTVWREDVVEACPLREGILSNAPGREELFFKVPKVIE